MPREYYHVIEPSRYANGLPVCGQFDHKLGSSYAHFALTTSGNQQVAASGTGFDGAVVITAPYGISHALATLCGWADLDGEPADLAWNTNPQPAGLGTEGWPWGPNYFLMPGTPSLADLDAQSNAAPEEEGRMIVRAQAMGRRPMDDAPGSAGSIGFACSGGLGLATNGGNQYIASSVHGAGTWIDPPGSFKGLPPNLTHLQAGLFVLGFGNIVCHEVMTGVDGLIAGQATVGAGTSGHTVVTRLSLDQDARVHGVGITMCGGPGYASPSFRGCIYDDQVVGGVAHPHALLGKTPLISTYPGIVQASFDEEILLPDGMYWVGASFLAADVPCGIHGTRPGTESCVSCANGAEGPPAYFGTESPRSTHMCAAMLGRPGRTQPLVMCV